jgi:hypothetical protein
VAPHLEPGQHAEDCHLKLLLVLLDLHATDEADGLAHDPAQRHQLDGLIH